MPTSRGICCYPSKAGGASGRASAAAQEPSCEVQPQLLETVAKMRSLLLLLLVAAAGSCHAGFISIRSQVWGFEIAQPVCEDVDLLNEQGLQSLQGHLRGFEAPQRYLNSLKYE